MKTKGKKKGIQKFEVSDNPIIQIATSGDLLFALTKNGLLYTTNAKKRKQWVNVKVPEGYKL